MSRKKTVAAAEHAAMLIIAKIIAVLEAPNLPLTPRDLGVLADALRYASGVLGVQTQLDDREQRAKIDVLKRRAGDHTGPQHVEISFLEGVEEYAE